MIIKLRMLMLLGLLISGVVFFSGCVQEKALTVSIETPTVQPTTFTNKTPIVEITTYVEKTPTVQPTTFTNKTPIVEITTYVEKTSTVQPITSTEIYCVSKETGEKMGLSEARKIANNSDIGDQGTLKDTYSCNESTSTWWIDMNPTIEQNACNPAYVVNINTKEVEINWRCTAAIIRITPITNTHS